MFRKIVVAVLRFLKVIADYWLGVLEVETQECSLKGADMQSLIEQSIHPILIVDNDLHRDGLRCLFASSRWIQVWGLEGKTIIGKSLYTVLPFFYDRWREEHRQCLLEGKIIANDYGEAFIYGGKDYHIYWQVRPWFCNNTVTGMILEVLDHTECYQLSKQSKTIEKTNGILLATIAHQIKSRCRDMLIRVKNKEPINYSLENLSEVTENLIQLGAASNSDCNEKVNLKALLNQVVFNKKFQDFVSIEMEDLYFRGNKKLIGEVIYEILHNADKYKKGILRIEVTGKYCDEGNRYLLKFKDYGIGIPHKKIPLLGTPFFRLHREIDGTGLGITFIQLVCDKHDIICSYESRHPENTTVNLLFKTIIHEKNASSTVIVTR